MVATISITDPNVVHAWLKADFIEVLEVRRQHPSMGNGYVVVALGHDGKYYELGVFATDSDACNWVSDCLHELREVTE